MAELQWKMQTQRGPLYLVASEKGLKCLFWAEQSAPYADSLKEASSPQIQILQTAVQQLTEYFSGQRTKFEIPLEMEGTDFQKKVWEQLLQIPYGKTCSYAQLAHALNQPTASRAVGTANGKNPLCIIVPCHRVITSQGELGGYSGGLAMKSWLLELENGLEKQTSFKLAENPSL